MPSQLIHKTLRVVFAMLTLAATASCWGPAGHKIVAIIAEQRLSPQVRDKIRKLLMDGQYSMADIASCADAIRGTPRPGQEMCQPLAGSVPSTNGLWHYIDIPVPTDGSKSLDAFCPEGNCVTAKINSFSQVLRTSNDDALKRQALLFLVHFIGDIHQPLHAAERACDRGGNSEHVNFFLGPEPHPNLTLHSVWDSQEVALLMKRAGFTDDQAYAAELMKHIHRGKAEQWSRATPDQIAWESYKLATKYAYAGIPYQDFCNNQKPQPIITDLTKRYEEKGTKIVREQLMKAGVRLAAILEADLGAN
jgi:S1/P1 Nuclease